MRKDFKKFLTKLTALALSIVLVIPCISMGAVDTYAEGAALIKTLDFDKGFREFYDNDSAYKIINAGGQVLHKTPEQREEGDRVDANGFVIQGEGEKTKYYTQSPGNQPSTKHDTDKGTVLFLAGTYDVPELVKELPANIEGDEYGSKLLDEALPVGTVVRKAATFKAAVTVTNQFRKVESDSAVLAFWAKVPADATEEKIALIEFSSGETAVSFCYDTTVESISEKGKWYYFSYVITKDGAKGYINGEESAIATVVDGTAPEDMITFLKTADIYFGATNTSSLRTVEETVIDDVSFYDGAMTKEEVKSVYDAALADYEYVVDIANPLAFYAMDTTEAFEDINPENPSAVETFNINGHAVNGVAVVENLKGAEKNGIKIDNPFSGKEFDGATIGYWIQVEPKTNIINKGSVNNPDKGYTGNYPGEYLINETVTLAFMDTNKVIYNPKHGESAEGYSYLYTRNRMQGYFEEGSFFGMNTGNQFECDSAEEDATKYIDESREWHYMTLVINNSGITIYRDGNKIEGLYEMRAPRFMDGYYRRVSEREKIYTLYGAFGGSGNQLTSLITTFLGYEDTDIYFGWLPTSEYRNETTSPMNISRMSFYDDDMTSDKVKALYETELATIMEMPEYVEEPEYKAGDINKDDVVDASDALIVLKIAAKLEEAAEDAVEIADLNADGILNAEDALSILKIAAKLV